MKLKIIFRKLTKGLYPGDTKSVRKSYRGSDIEDLREFDERIDPLPSVNVPVSARRGKLMVVLRRAERGFSSLFAVDFSSSVMNFSSQTIGKQDLVVNFIKDISEDLIESSSPMGLVLFSDKIGPFIPPKFGRKQVKKIIHTIKDCKKENACQTRFPHVLDFISREIKNPSLIFLFTDGFLGPVGNYKKRLLRLSNIHDVISIVVRDRTEINLPKLRFGQVCFRDVETGREVSGNQVRTDNSFLETCREIGIASEVFVIDDSTQKQWEALHLLFLRHAQRR